MSFTWWTAAAGRHGRAGEGPQREAHNIRCAGEGPCDKEGVRGDRRGCRHPSRFGHQLSTEEIPKLIKALDDCDVVVGSRFKGKIEDGAMKGVNRLGNMALTAMGNVLYWKGASDICSGFWAFRKEAYKKMDIDAPHFSLEANFYVECVKKKLRLHEVPITYGIRKGETKLTIAHGFDIGLYLLRKRL